MLTGSSRRFFKDQLGELGELEAFCGRERSRGPQQSRFRIGGVGEREPAAEILSEAERSRRNPPARQPRCEERQFRSGQGEKVNLVNIVNMWKTAKFTTYPHESKGPGEQ